MALVRRVPVRALLVFWLFLLSAIAFLDRTNISIAGSAIRDELGLDNIRLGWVFSAFLVSYAACQLIGGWLAYRFGPRRVLAAGVLWWGVFSALTTLASPRMGHALLMLILVRFALGAGEAVVYPSTNQFVAMWIPVAERGRANGWIFAGVGAGAGTTIPLLTWIIIHWGWRATFWFSAIAGFVIGLVWFVMARDLPEQHPLVSAEELRVIQAGRSVIGHDHLDGPGSWSEALMNRNVVALTLSAFTFGYVAWIFFSWFFIYMAQAHGMNLKANGVVSTLPFIAMTVFCLVGGSITDKLSRRFGLRRGRCGISVASLLLAAVFLLVGSRVAGPYAATLVLAGGAGVLYLSQAAFWAVTADIGGKRSGIVSSVMNMGGQIGGAVTASLTPWLATRFGWSVAFDFAAALAAVGALMWMIIDPVRHRGARSPVRSTEGQLSEG